MLGEVFEPREGGILLARYTNKVILLQIPPVTQAIQEDYAWLQLVHLCPYDAAIFPSRQHYRPLF